MRYHLFQSVMLTHTWIAALYTGDPADQTNFFYSMPFDTREAAEDWLADKLIG